MKLRIDDWDEHVLPWLWMRISTKIEGDTGLEIACVLRRRWYAYGIRIPALLAECIIALMAPRAREFRGLG